jgi:hypothetical protein
VTTTRKALLGSGALSTKGLLRYSVKSAEKGGPTYRLAVRALDGRCHCECPHFAHRCAWASPTIDSPDAMLCKHLRTYRSEIQRDLETARNR